MNLFAPLRCEVVCDAESQDLVWFAAGVRDVPLRKVIWVRLGKHGLQGLGNAVMVVWGAVLGNRELGGELVLDGTRRRTMFALGESVSQVARRYPIRRHLTGWSYHKEASSHAELGGVSDTTGTLHLYPWRLLKLKKALKYRRNLMSVMDASILRGMRVPKDTTGLKCQR